MPYLMKARKQRVITAKGAAPKARCMFIFIAQRWDTSHKVKRKHTKRLFVDAHHHHSPSLWVSHALKRKDKFISE